MVRATTTEQTAKRWKATQGIGCMGSILGLVMVIVGIQMINRDAPQPSMISVWGAVMLIVGLPAYFVGRIGAWWYHG